MRIILFFITSCIIISCSSKNGVLTENFVIRTLVDTSLNKLTTTDIYARMTSQHEISGFGGGYFFKIDDYKQMLQLSPGTLVQPVIYNSDNFNELTVLNQYENTNAYLINRTLDYGFSYQTIFSLKKRISDTINGYPISGDNYYRNAYLMNATTGWLFFDFDRLGGSSVPDTGRYKEGIHVYKIYETNIVYLSTINKKYNALDAFFENDMNGKLLVYDKSNTGKLFIYQTLDGGLSWLGPFPLTPMNPAFGSYARIAYMNTDRYLIYSFSGLAQSNDGCNTFKAITIDSLQYPSIADIHVINENLIYAAVSTNSSDAFGPLAYIYKSNDIGQTWQKVSKQMVYAGNIHFFDYLNGVATYANIVQITHDGGQTWKPIVFPIHFTQ